MPELMQTLLGMAPRFQLGRLVWTLRVNDLLAEDEEFGAFVLRSLRRHARGDWGELCAEDRKQNDLALSDGARLFSAYWRKDQPKVWIITEADRSLTTVLFPSEY